MNATKAEVVGDSIEAVALTLTKELANIRFSGSKKHLTEEEFRALFIECLSLAKGHKTQK